MVHGNLCISQATREEKHSRRMRPMVKLTWKEKPKDMVKKRT